MTEAGRKAQLSMTFAKWYGEKGKMQGRLTALPAFLKFAVSGDYQRFPLKIPSFSPSFEMCFNPLKLWGFAFHLADCFGGVC